jgi:nucleotidyltransferase substrate binding protein (TIGR01987 family)
MNETEQKSFERLGLALDRLQEALQETTQNPLAIDGTIQRFEFCFELTWKLARLVGRRFGIEEQSPRQVLKAAFQQSWVNDESVWLRMLEDRNQSSHTYREEVAIDVYSRVGEHYRAMLALFDRLKCLASDTTC